MASRRGFGVRLDKPGVRPSGGKATDIETYVTEYLRDKLADAEETLSSGGGDTRLMQQRLSAMEAEVSAAIRLGAEVDMLRSQLRDKDEQISILRPGAGDASQELRGRLEQQQERVRGLEQENAIITRERELGISTVGGSVSQERYDQLVAENKRLALQIERGEADGGAGGLSSVDLMDLQGVKRDVKKMKQEKEELQRRYEEEVARRRELEEQGPLGGFAAENPGTMRELRDKIANLVIQNKQLSAAAEGSHQVMFDAQQKVEEKVIEMEDLRRDKDSEIAALEKNIQQAQQDWGKEKNAIIWDQKEHHQALEANLTHERKSNVELQAMLEEVATTLEREVQARSHWEDRAGKAENSLHIACRMQGIDVGNFQPQPLALAPAQSQQYGSVANSQAMYGQPPPPEGQPPYAQQQQLMPPSQQQYGQERPASVASYRH